MKVLLIEDRDSDALLIKEALADLKYECLLTRVKGGREAFAFLENLPPHDFPDLILLDLSMPEISGDEVLRVLKDHSRWKIIPVVVLTTSNSPEDRKKCQELNTDGYLTKPFSFEELTVSIKGTLDYWNRVYSPSY